jgi:hypothetical protein
MEEARKRVPLRQAHARPSTRSAQSGRLSRRDSDCRNELSGVAQLTRTFSGMVEEHPRKGDRRVPLIQGR